MSQFVPPLEDFHFIIEELAGLDEICTLPGTGQVTPDLAGAILEEAGKFAVEVLAPLNRVGDIQGCRIEGGRVITPDGWIRAYAQFREAGWVGLGLPTEFGGQGLPKVLSAPVNELWAASNLAFSLLFPLINGATESLSLAASDELKSIYLPQIIAGKWTGAMDLTEPQSGSDLSTLRTRAEPQPDGSYQLHGQKIFITYGEHDLVDNIVHLVLARIPGAPEGVKGISLFIVPKFLVNADGSLGARNDVHCASIEHKLGIHGSPTCLMVFGDHGGAAGYLVGERNRGLEYMFIMMNEARFGTGLQGIAIGERAYQQALAYAKDRRQGRDAVTGEKNIPIIHHLDVQRMLFTMRAKVMAARMMAYTVAGMFDRYHCHPDRAVAEKNGRLVDLLIPVVKGWSADVGNEVASLGVQIHGGMGFVEETGAAQHMRDARIISIYEGTTGIQANDLIGRKILREQGGMFPLLIGEMRAVLSQLAQDKTFIRIFDAFALGISALESTHSWILQVGRERYAEVLAGAVPFLYLMGIVCGGWQMSRAALAAQARLHDGRGDSVYNHKMIQLANFYCSQFLPLATAYGEVVRHGGADVAAFGNDST